MDDAVAVGNESKGFGVGCAEAFGVVWSGADDTPPKSLNMARLLLRLWAGWPRVGRPREWCKAGSVVGLQQWRLRCARGE